MTVQVVRDLGGGMVSMPAMSAGTTGRYYVEAMVETNGGIMTWTRQVSSVRAICNGQTTRAASAAIMGAKGSIKSDVGERCYRLWETSPHFVPSPGSVDAADVAADVSPRVFGIGSLRNQVGRRRFMRRMGEVRALASCSLSGQRGTAAWRAGGNGEWGGGKGIQRPSAAGHCHWGMAGNVGTGKMARGARMCRRKAVANGICLECGVLGGQVEVEGEYVGRERLGNPIRLRQGGGVGWGVRMRMCRAHGSRENEAPQAEIGDSAAGAAGPLLSASTAVPTSSASGLGAEDGRKLGVLRVGVICGGASEERGISLNSARSVLDHLRVRESAAMSDIANDRDDSTFLLVFILLQWMNRRTWWPWPCPRQPLRCRWGTGGFYRQTAHGLGLGLMSAMRSNEDVTDVLINGYGHLLQFPTGDKLQETLDVFERKGFTGCVGAINCTHVYIEKPRNERGECYYDRNDQFSVVVHVVCDHECQIVSVYVGCPGSVQGSLVLRTSPLYRKAQQQSGVLGMGAEVLPDGRAVGRYLLADAGYPNLPWLMTPVSGTSSTPVEQVTTIATRRQGRASSKLSVD
ncbi:hypothetical protein CBR_g45572 [Chara braunii]|uniref:DDE Tnp4 domain-containing protein n=1 Tax=Chara braunii TaxID=69332 RepID=A0A388LYW3_CHABU|nr:hypothetical protein CBR_g45572 [Chara braunii]|eukprot:GBG87514.1 hypothetical protein CBR_g45572 [Chara braunii]